MKVFRINTSDHVRHLWPTVMVLILLPAIMYFISMYKKGYFDLNMAVWAGGIGITVYLIPLISLHLNHYFKNKDDLFEYDQLSGEIVYQKRDSKLSFRNEDIQKITVFKSRPLAENRTPILIWDEYNYAVIELKNGRVLKLSSLLVYELDKVVKFENTEIRKTLYAWIS